jgi:hypothetical protein
MVPIVVRFIHFLAFDNNKLLENWAVALLGQSPSPTVLTECPDISVIRTPLHQGHKGVPNRDVLLYIQTFLSLRQKSMKWTRTHFF